MRGCILVYVYIALFRIIARPSTVKLMPINAIINDIAIHNIEIGILTIFDTIVLAETIIMVKTIKNENLQFSKLKINMRPLILSIAVNKDSYIFSFILALKINHLLPDIH